MRNIITQWFNRTPKPRTDGDIPVVIITRRGPVIRYLRSLLFRRKPTAIDLAKASAEAAVLDEAHRLEDAIQHAVDALTWPNLIQPPKVAYGGKMPSHAGLGTLTVWAQLDQPTLRLPHLTACLHSVARVLQSCPGVLRFDGLILGVQVARAGRIADPSPTVTKRKFNTVMSRREYQSELAWRDGTVFETIVRVLTIPPNLNALQPPNPSDLLPGATPSDPKFATRWHTTDPKDTDLTIPPTP